MFMNSKTQYCQDVSFPQIDVQIQFNPLSNAIDLFMDIDKLILKFICRDKRPGITKIIFKRQNKCRGMTILNFMPSYTATVNTNDIFKRMGK